MKRSSVVTPLFIGAALWAGAQTQAQDTNPDHVTVTWSDPSRPGLLKINLLSGGISVKTHSGPEVIIDAKSRGGGPGRRRAPAESGGLRRIDLGANDLVVEESDNVMSVSTSIFRDVDLEIQVPLKTNLNLNIMKPNLNFPFRHFTAAVLCIRPQKPSRRCVSRSTTNSAH